MINPRIVDDGVSGFRIEVTELGNNGTFPLSNLVIAQNISYNALHTLEIKIQFVDGVNLTTEPGGSVEVNGNDIVKYYLNGMMIHTGTTWEAYYYWNERSDIGTPQNPRIQAVNSLIFRLAGTAAANSNGGFYFEEVLLATRFCPHQLYWMGESCYSSWWLLRPGSWLLGGHLAVTKAVRPNIPTPQEEKGALGYLELWVSY